MIRKRTYALAVVLIVLLASSAFSACKVKPIDGIYSTYAGNLLPGRASEAWCTVMSPNVPGNAQNAESWNGTALATQWRVWGMTIDPAGAVVTASNLDAYGNGWVDYNINYDGGSFWLAGTGPWGGPTEGFTGYITYYNVSTRVTFIGGQMVGATANVYCTGTFNNCPTCAFEYAIANAMLVWQTGWPNQPACYPAFLCDACAGEYFDVCCIQAKVMCDEIDTETSTWGAIKSIYR